MSEHFIGNFLGNSGISFHLELLRFQEQNIAFWHNKVPLGYDISIMTDYSVDSEAVIVTPSSVVLVPAGTGTLGPSTFTTDRGVGLYRAFGVSLQLANGDFTVTTSLVQRLFPGPGHPPYTFTPPEGGGSGGWKVGST